MALVLENNQKNFWLGFWGAIAEELVSTRNPVCLRDRFPRQHGSDR